MKNIEDLRGLSKNHVIELAKEEAKELINEAMTNELDLYIELKRYSEYINTFANTLHDSAFTEYEKHEQKDVELKGFKISSFETGVKYDFTNCNHEVLNHTVSEIDKLNHKRKELEKFLKGVREPITVVDEETGDVNQYKPPVKSSTTKLKITF